MKVIYKITYPNGKIYIGKDLTNTLNYFYGNFRFSAVHYRPKNDKTKSWNSFLILGYKEFVSSNDFKSIPFCAMEVYTSSLFSVEGDRSFLRQEDNLGVNSIT